MEIRASRTRCSRLRKLFADIRNPDPQMDANGRAPCSSITDGLFENRGETRHQRRCSIGSLYWFLFMIKLLNGASSSLALETINSKQVNT